MTTENHQLLTGAGIEAAFSAMDIDSAAGAIAAGLSGPSIAHRPSSIVNKRPTAAVVRQWAMRYDDIAAAEAAEGMTASLAAMLKRYPSLNAAWSRGRLLRDLRRMGSSSLPFDQIEQHLDLEAGALEKLFAADVEAADVFNDARIAAIVAIDQALQAEYKKGKPGAASVMMAMMKRDVAKKSTDFEHVPVQMMASLIGISRQVLQTDWVKKFDCPKNADGTYSLYKFIPWFEQFTVEKINKQPGRFLPASANPLQAKKAERLQIEMDKERGQLLDRGAVISGIVARYQALVHLAERKGAELPMLLAGQPAEKIAPELKEFFAALRKQLQAVGPELKLPESAAAKLAEVFELIG